LGREGGVAFHSPHSRVVALAMRGLAERPISGLRAQLPSVGEDRRLRPRQRFLPGETGSLGSAPRPQGCVFGHCAAEHLLGDNAFARERPRGDPATYGVGVGAVYSVRLQLGVVVGARAAAVAVAVAMTVAMAVSWRSRASSMAWFACRHSAAKLVSREHLGCGRHSPARHSHRASNNAGNSRLAPRACSPSPTTIERSRESFRIARAHWRELCVSSHPDASDVGQSRPSPIGINARPTVVE